MKRAMSVSGTFYPARGVELERYFEHFSKVYDENFTLPNIKSRAVIVPHAGYVYSGYTANIAYRILVQSGVKNLLVIGPSHRIGFDGASICEFSSYDTPFGDISASDRLYERLKDNFGLQCIVSAHHEHSTEVQFPFIKHYLDGVNIVEIVYSQSNPKDISNIIDFVLSQDECGVVISTDLSHFYTLEEANRVDSICLDSIESLNTEMFQRGCEACGNIGVLAMMLSAQNAGLKSTILDYRTSADASGDKDRVVGYVSACFS